MANSGTEHILDDLVEVNLGAIRLPPDCKVFVHQTSPDCFRGFCINRYSGALSSRWEALRWVKQGYDVRVGITPDWGQLWQAEERVVIVLGNSIHDDGTIWCADNLSGETLYPEVKKLCRLQALQFSQSLKVTVQKCIEWASRGNSDIMWWLGWWFEGTNHAKSLWYYVAAMRKNPRKNGEFLSRVYSDAQAPVMCEGVPAPDLAFHSKIQEFNGSPRWGDWKEALAQAEKS